MDINHEFSSSAHDEQGEQNKAANTEAQLAADVRAGSRKRLAPIIGASLFSIAWVSFISYLVYAGDLALSATNVSAQVLELAPLCLPVAIFWLIALVFQRSDPMLERRLALSQTLNTAMAPVEQAELRLASLSKHLRSELKNVEGVSALAAERIENLESRFQAQVSDLFSAAADAEARATTISEALARERAALDTMSQDLLERFTSLKASVNEIDHDLQQSNTALLETTGQVSETLGDVTSNLLRQADGAQDKLKSTIDELASFNKHIEESAVDIELRLHGVSDNITGGVDTLRRDVEGLENRSAELSDHMQQQGKILGELATLAADESAKIEETLRSHVSEVRDSAQAALDRTEQVSDRVAKRANELTSDVCATFEQAEATLNTASTAFKDHCDQALATSQDMLKKLEAHTTATRDHVDQQSEQVEVRLSQSLDRAKTVMQEAAKALTTHGETSAQEAESVSERTLSYLRQLRTSIEVEIEAFEVRAIEAGSKLTGATDQIKQQADAIALKSNDIELKVASSRTAMDEQSTALFDSLTECHERLSHLEQDLTDQRSAMMDTAREANKILVEAGHEFSARTHEINAAAQGANDIITQQSSALEGKMRSIEASGQRASESVEHSAMALREAATDMRNELSLSRRALGDAADNFTTERSRIQLDTTDVVNRLNSASSEMAEEVNKFAESSSKAAGELDIASKTVLEQSQAAQEALRQTVYDTKTELSEGMEGLSNTARDRIIILQEEMEATLDRLLKEYQEHARFAERESAHLAMRIGNEAAKIEEKTQSIIQASDTLEKRLSQSTRESFAKTSKLLMQNLQSASIDVNRALETDIPDDQWDQYLSGDKSLFVRKTLKLGDRRSKKKILEKFESDREFKDAVLRYMRDFESLMQQAMQGDTSGPMSVTLLSSDMGKLYVLMGQSIKRFN